jgi:DNA-binding MarR family transcriptional regulator
MAREIKLNGRELGIMRTIGFGLGVPGSEIQERTNIDHEDLCDVLNTLLDIGYIETPTMKERVSLEEMATELFEINPSYVSDLKIAMRR